MSSPAWPLETERLVLRPFRAADLAAMHRMQSDEDVVRWLYEGVRSEQETKRLLDRKMAVAALTEEGQWLSCAITLRESGEVVGDLSLHWVSEQHRCGEIGFILASAHQGLGYATEAAAALLPFAFETMGWHRLIGRTEVRNVGSARVLEKLGMRLEAHLVENEWVKDEWQSEFDYALLDREWRQQGR